MAGENTTTSITQSNNTQALDNSTPNEQQNGNLTLSTFEDISRDANLDENVNQQIDEQIAEYKLNVNGTEKIYTEEKLRKFYNIDPNEGLSDNVKKALAKAAETTLKLNSKSIGAQKTEQTLNQIKQNVTSYITNLTTPQTAINAIPEMLREYGWNDDQIMNALERMYEPFARLQILPPAEAQMEKLRLERERFAKEQEAFKTQQEQTNSEQQATAWEHGYSQEINMALSQAGMKIDARMAAIVASEMKVYVDAGQKITASQAINNIINRQRQFMGAMPESQVSNLVDTRTQEIIRKKNVNEYKSRQQITPQSHVKSSNGQQRQSNGQMTDFEDLVSDARKRV